MRRKKTTKSRKDSYGNSRRPSGTHRRSAAEIPPQQPYICTMSTRATQQRYARLAGRVVGIQSNRRLDASMWRAVILLSLFTANFCQFSASTINGIYTEGNQQRVPLAADSVEYLEADYVPQKQQYYVQEAEEPQAQSIVEQQLQQQFQQQYEQLLQQRLQQQKQWSDAQKERYLQGIIEQLRNERNMRKAPADQRADAYAAIAAAAQLPRSGKPSIEDKTLSELEELQRFTAKIRQLERGSSSTASNTSPELPSAEQLDNRTPNVYWPMLERPLSAQKKGQSEFVEFVEPHNSKVLNGIEFMEKRVPLDLPTNGNSHSLDGFGFISASGNVAFLAILTMGCVVAAIGIVGGTYYFYHVRNVCEDPFDDFTHYSPAGPGRDRFKKSSGDSPLGARVSEKGDDALAYKAQLHHYQQTKQKIIGDGATGVSAGGITGGGNAVGASCGDLTDRSDDEDDGADLDHNFSVYECPGLAPTGDIEVQNPNFVEMVPK